MKCLSFGCTNIEEVDAEMVPLRLRMIVTLVFVASSCVFETSTGAMGNEPSTFNNSSSSQDSEGIAARYPGDEGIHDDERVVFVESFSSETIDEIGERWESVENKGGLSLSELFPAGSSDSQSLLVTHVGGASNGSHLYRRLEPGYDKLHYRFYVRFDQDCGPIHHFFHVGGYNPATPWPQGGAGSRPDGNERLSTGIEPFGDAWQWDFYSYWMEMRGSPPRGQCWGNSFLQDESLKVPRDQWICVELMMKLNDVGSSNGEMALWIDGKQVGHLGEGFPKGMWRFDRFMPGEGGEAIRWNDDRGAPETWTEPDGGTPFTGFRWRDDESLELNFVWLLTYITKAPRGHVSKIWFDQIVVATDYIGPIKVQ